MSVFSFIEVVMEAAVSGEKTSRVLGVIKEWVLNRHSAQHRVRCSQTPGRGEGPELGAAVRVFKNSSSPTPTRRRASLFHPTPRGQGALLGSLDSRDGARAGVLSLWHSSRGIALAGGRLPSPRRGERRGDELVGRKVRTGFPERELHQTKPSKVRGSGIYEAREEGEWSRGLCDRLARVIRLGVSDTLGR